MTQRRTTSRSTRRGNRPDYHRINALADICGYRIEELLDHLGLSLQRKGKMLAGPCPVHGGRGLDAFNIYPDGHTVRGNWKCRSRACHLEFKSARSGSGTLIGLVWGVLSHRRLNWRGPADRKVPFADVVEFLCEFVGTPLAEVRVDMAEVEKKKFIVQQETMGRVPQAAAAGWARSAVRQRMEVPAAYYLARGYLPETLERYDVGLWLPGRGEASPMAGRVAVPVFDDAHARVVGVTARSVHPRCPSCEQFHDPGGDCPTEKRKEFAKWMNSPGFRKEAHLYNYWFAREHIRRTGVVVLVEGPGDVWRLEEAGVRNSVAMFGNELSDPQQIVLERSGATTVVLFPHRDEAGEASRRQVERELGRSYRLRFIDPQGKDVGEMAAQDIERDIVPALDGLAGEGRPWSM